MRYLLPALLLVLTACDPLGNFTPEPTPPQITLSASQTTGESPLSVTFRADANPPAEVFSWAVGGELQTETSRAFQTTFERSGLYVVSVAANGASASETVTVTAPDVPGTGPNIGNLKLTQTPGGPAPWAVRYTVTADADLSGSPAGLEARCSERAAYRQVVSGSFSCVHNGLDTVSVRFALGGETTASADLVPKITQNDGVAFAGRWRYTSRGVTETFEIVKGSETAGRSADGRFELFTVGQRDGLIVEFTLDGRTVVLTPVPADDGAQLYEGPVYGLVLEPLPDAE